MLTETGQKQRKNAQQKEIICSHRIISDRRVPGSEYVHTGPMDITSQPMDDSPGEKPPKIMFKEELGRGRDG